MKIRVPAEWEAHRAVWMAWPHLSEEWPDLHAARIEIERFIKEIAKTERVELLVNKLSDVAEGTFDGHNVGLHEQAIGDSWTRDTSCIFAQVDGQPTGLCFRFDGWGGKYLMPGDGDLSGRIAELAGVSKVAHDLTLEGGGLEFDGVDTLLTTRDSLAPRNPHLTEDQISERLCSAFGVKRVIWLDAALRNDHTDGHIDTLVRFVKPGEVVCMKPVANDPNGAMLLALEEQLIDLGFVVHTIPSPGLVLSDEQEIMPASYCNYYLPNGRVLVPLYGSLSDAAAVEELAKLFPTREAVGLPAKAILAGGGAFHCITQQEPTSR